VSLLKNALKLFNVSKSLTQLNVVTRHISLRCFFSLVSCMKGYGTYRRTKIAEKPIDLEGVGWIVVIIIIVAYCERWKTCYNLRHIKDAHLCQLN